MSKDLKEERELGMHISEGRVFRHREQPVQRLQTAAFMAHSRTAKEAAWLEWGEQGEEVAGDEFGEVRTLHAMGGGKMGFPRGLTKEC